jgi:hypothetical protein
MEIGALSRTFNNVRSGWRYIENEILGTANRGEHRIG